ncbi:hypothetical protein MSAN_02439800 [Mycena sanguinolenta]|uniref:Uncharacterized protein n=1 Tax=Mycena sanguinolenta TaxID=230812 RepID=A0A8H7CBG6_9AGAR|nr:hypothetical protein MSAN_02439800 [Mycena sanguinolenta]
MCFQFFRLRGGSPTIQVGGNPSDTMYEEAERNVPGMKPEPVVGAKTAQTATNVLVFSLRALSTVSNRTPLAGVLSETIDHLLEITAHIKQTSANAQGLAQLAARIERLTPIVTGVAQADPKGRAIVQNLQKELASMTLDLKAADGNGKLSQFFNRVENASTLQKHNNALVQMIAECTLVSVQDVVNSLRELENSKLQDLYGAEMAGETGIIGSTAYIGGEGGEGAGPQLDVDPDEPRKFRKIAGGTGGNGVERGGKGGTGKGPLINMRRGRLGARFTAKEPQAEEV